MPTKPAWTSTACILCECNCGIEVELGGDDGRQLLRFRGDKRHPLSKGYACEKPHRLNFYQNDPYRLTSPLRRKSDGTHEEISWEVAIREVADRLAAVRDTHGGASIFYYSWESRTGLPSQVVMQAQRQSMLDFEAGRITGPQLDAAIRVTEY